MGHITARAACLQLASLVPVLPKLSPMPLIQFPAPFDDPDFLYEVKFDGENLWLPDLSSSGAAQWLACAACLSAGFP